MIIYMIGPICFLFIEPLRASIGATAPLKGGVIFHLSLFAVGLLLYIRLHAWRAQVRALGWDVTIRHLIFNPLCTNMALSRRRLIRKEDYLLLPHNPYLPDPKNEIEMIQRAMEATHGTETILLSDERMTKILIGTLAGLVILGGLLILLYR